METNHSGTKECPMCAENVKQKAKICRFCRHEFVFLTEETNHISSDTSESAVLKEIYYDVWIMSCPTAFHSLVSDALITECFFEKKEALKLVHSIPTKLFEGLTRDEGEYYKTLLEKVGAKVSVQESDTEEHVTKITEKYLNQLDNLEPNEENYHESISTDYSAIKATKTNESEDEDFLEEEIDTKAWEVFDKLKSNQNPPESSKNLELRCDVWIKGSYSDKLCNEIIKITQWESWIVGKFLLDLEESSVPMKLVENLSTIDAQNIKKNLEGEGATITIEFYN
tara:strand:- start:2944 stop:3792 length:849 start_codon:yes stop_codon:yes gene_type:complete